jgi:hypothetical protein
MGVFDTDEMAGAASHVLHLRSVKPDAVPDHMAADAARAFQGRRKRYRVRCAFALCDREFYTVAIGKYCSKACRQKAYYHRRRVPKPPPPRFAVGKDGMIVLPHDPRLDIIAERASRRHADPA